MNTALPQNKQTFPQVVNPPSSIATALRLAIEQKALDVVGLDVRKATDVTDYMLIASGTSQRHVLGIADKVMEALAQEKIKPLSKAGYEYGDWVVLDYADFVMHIFYEPVRSFYQIEELWPLAPQVSLPEELERAAKRLRTGIYTTRVE